jgi:hypothetical protein
MKSVIFALLIAIIATFASALLVGRATIANISGVIVFCVSLLILNRRSPKGKILKIILAGMVLLALVVIALIFWLVSNMGGH